MVAKPSYAELENRIKDLEDQCNRYKNTEAELIRSAEFTKSLLNSIPTPIFFKDEQGRYQGCNPAFSEIMGVRVEEIMGKTVHELWPSAHAEVYHQKDLELMQNPTHQVYEFEIKDKDGSIRPVIYYKNTFYDEHGKVAGLVGGFVDISEQKIAEEILKEAYDIIKESPAVAFLWKNAEGWPVEYVSENVVSLLGYTAEELMSGTVSYGNVVHPEDLERVGREVETFSVETGRERFNHIPYRIVTQDGTVKWVRDSTTIRRNQDETITHYHGIVEDISETIETEEALRESETMFRTLVENSQAGIFLVDQQYRFIYANEELSHILGYGLDEIEGMDFRSVLDEESREFVADRYVRRQKGEEVPKRIEVGIVRKDGETRCLEMVATAINNPDGTVQTMGQVLDITDRKEAEKSLRDSEERFRELAENIREVFWLFDWEKRSVIYVSPAYEEIWGRPINDLLDRYVEWADSIHPDDLNFAQESFADLVERGVDRPREYRIVRPNGEIRWILDRGVVIRDAGGGVVRIAGIAEDITERKQIEIDLKYSERFLQNVFNGIRDGISVLDSDLTIISVNYWMEEMYHTRKPLAGKKCYEVYHDRREACTWCPSLKTLRTGEVCTEEVPYPFAEGEPGWLELSTFPLRDSRGEITGIIEHVKDITDRKKIEEELNRYHQQLEELVKERTRDLELTQEELLKNERLAILGQLTATVSHELRNPLGVIRSSAFYLQQKNQEKNQKIIKHINRIEDQVEICDAIVSDLLEYTRGRHSQMLVGEINPWLKQVLKELSATSDIQMDVDLAADLPQFQFDKEKVRRVTVNSMDNAFQALAERKKLVTDKTFEPRIEVTTQAEGQSILIRVTDNGIGMEAATRERAFEPLFTTRARGTGLGLANVQKIVEEHKGRVSIQSQPAAGTTVIVSLPVLNSE